MPVLILAAALGLAFAIYARLAGAPPAIEAWADVGTTLLSLLALVAVALLRSWSRPAARRVVAVWAGLLTALTPLAARPYVAYRVRIATVYQMQDKGVAALGSGRYRWAETDFRQVVGLLPDDTGAPAGSPRRLRGELHRMLTDAHYDLGLALMAQYRYADAAPEFGAAMARGTNTFNAYYNRGLCRLRLDPRPDLAGARADFITARRLASDAADRARADQRLRDATE